MKLTINKQHLLNGLNKVVSVIDTRGTMPILGNVLLTAKEGRLSIATTNLDQSISCTVKAEVIEQGTFTLPAKKLSLITKELPELEVTLRVSKTVAHISSGRSKFMIRGIVSDKFPSLPVVEQTNEYTIKQPNLARMLRSVSHAKSTDENRYVLNGVFFEFVDGKMNTVATDGRKLCTISDDVLSDSSEKSSLIVPSKTVGELEKLLVSDGDIKISFNDRIVKFTIDSTDDSTGVIGSIEMTSKTVEGRFPDYVQVIPKDSGKFAVIDSQAFIEVVSRSMLVLSDKSFKVSLTFKDGLIDVSGQSMEHGEYNESIDAKTNHSGDVRIDFNPRFLIDTVRSVADDSIQFGFEDEFQAGKIKADSGFIGVIMPLRIN